MARRASRKKNRNWIAAVISCAVVLFLILSSAYEKNGGQGLSGEGGGFFASLFEDYAEGYPAAGLDADIDASGLSVHFIDVGQAKSILVEAPGKTVLIDGGEADQGDIVIRYLKSRNVGEIDILIGTHPHSDHIGGLAAIVGAMPVGEVILPEIREEFTPTTRVYTALLESVDRAGLSITPAAPGDKYDLGGGAELAILGPAGDYDDLNDLSVVSRLVYGYTSFLFTGDATKNAESDILESGARVGATVLDVAHHGSDTSSSRDFLAGVSPSVAVISCGLDNMYGHPHREVVSSLKDYTQNIYRTDIDGSVVIATDGTGIDVVTEKGGE